MPFNPISAAEACIRRSRRLLTLAEQPLPDAQVKNDLRRSALVTAVTGVDSYMHWLVYRQISALRTAGDLPKSLARLNIPFTEFATLADAVIQARVRGVNSRPWVQVKHAMQKQLLRETFQSYDQVGTAFAWSGIEKGWSRVATVLGAQSNDVRDKLNALVHRRNQIVHEGDITRASRPRNLQYNDIDHATIVTDVDWVDQLVHAIETVVQAGNPL